MKSVPLDSFCIFTSGGKLKLSKQDYVPDGYPAFSAAGSDGFVKQWEFDRPAVVISSIGARCGKAFIATGKWTSLANTYCVFPDLSVADTKYIWYQLNDESSWIRSGSAQPFIKPRDIKARQVFLPSLKEQRRIAGLLDRAAEIRRRADAARAKARAIIPALFLDMFGDPATNPKGWPTKALADVASIGSGLTKGRKLTGSATTMVPYLRVANVQDGHLDLSEIKMIEATEADILKNSLRPGDLLMTEGGDPDKLGRCAIWNAEIETCVHQNHIFRVRVSETLLPAFAARYVQSDAGKAYFLKVAKRTTGIASVNKTQLGALPVWVPPLPLQTAFAEQAARIEAVAAALDSAALKADAMAAALSQEIFG